MLCLIELDIIGNIWKGWCNMKSTSLEKLKEMEEFLRECSIDEFVEVSNKVNIKNKKIFNKEKEEFTRDIIDNINNFRKYYKIYLQLTDIIIKDINISNDDIPSLNIINDNNFYLEENDEIIIFDDKNKKDKNTIYTSKIFKKIKLKELNEKQLFYLFSLIITYNKNKLKFKQSKLIMKFILNNSLHNKIKEKMKVLYRINNELEKIKNEIIDEIVYRFSLNYNLNNFKELTNIKISTSDLLKQIKNEIKYIKNN